MSRQIVYWDSNTFLALLNKEDEPDKCVPCEDVWISCERGEMLIVTSTLTIAEVIYKKGTPKLDPVKRPLINKFFRVGHIIQKPLTRAIAELARDVVWDFNIQAKDAVHVATAAYFKIGTIHTFDDYLLKQKAITINGFTIVLDKPHAKRQLELPTMEGITATENKYSGDGNITLTGDVLETQIEKDKQDMQETPQ